MVAAFGVLGSGMGVSLICTVPPLLHSPVKGYMLYPPGPAVCGRNSLVIWVSSQHNGTAGRNTNVRPGPFQSSLRERGVRQGERERERIQKTERRKSGTKDRGESDRDRNRCRGENIN